MIANISARVFTDPNFARQHSLPWMPKKKPERDFSSETVVTEQGGTGINLQRAGLDQMSGRNSFPGKVVKPWPHRLPDETVEAPSLEGFKARVDGALSNLV